MRARGLTLLEIMVSGAVLTMIVLLLLSSTMPMSRTAADANRYQDMDQTAMRVLANLRRELRQSGWDDAGASRVASPADGATGQVLTFQVRTGPGVADWGAEAITVERRDDGAFEGVAGGPLPRYKIVRTQGALGDVELARDVGELTFERPAGGSTVKITLRLVARDPHWAGPQAPPAVTRVYVETVQLLNPRP